MRQTTPGLASTIVLCWLAAAGLGSEANTPPTINPIPRASTTENTPIAVGFAADDAESGVGGLTFSGVSSNEALVPTANLVFGGNIPGPDINRSVRITPTPGQIGTTTITVTASDGNLTASRSFELTVFAGQLLEAEFHWTLAPRCDHVSGWCDSGGRLLWDRGTLEEHTPNTINRSCLDGWAGIRQFAGAIDRIKVSTVDGGRFAPGKTVRIEFTIWTPFANELLDVYVAPYHSSPAWTFLTTWTPTSGGLKTWSTTYVLPVGGLHAVRGHLRVGGSASPCTNRPDPPGPPGFVDDYDDLVFRGIAAKGDLNLDASSDLLWRNNVTGENVGWLMNGTTISSAAFLPTIADTNWKLRGAGDFNGDGQSDAIWRNTATGQNVVWLMNGLTVAFAAFLPTIADTNWEIQAVGYFDENSRADVILRNAATGQNIAWLMNGAVVASSAFLPTIADTNWGIVGVGDFDQDNRSDVVLRNKVTGENILWVMDGASVFATEVLPTVADTNWTIAVIGVLDGNGAADVIWRNTVTGENFVWLMNDTVVAATPSLPTIANTNWGILGAGADLDADGYADILWRNTVTGENIAWLMNQVTIRRATFLPTIADTNWEIVGK